MVAGFSNAFQKTPLYTTPGRGLRMGYSHAARSRPKGQPNALRLLSLAAVVLVALVPIGATHALPVKFPDSVKDLLLGGENGLNNNGHRHTRSSSSCNETSTPFTAQCGEECECIDGQWRCCRVRKSYNMLTRAEKLRFAKAYKMAAQDERFKPVMANLMWSHASIACDKIAKKTNMKRQLMSYHRLLVLAMENLLRLIDCNIILPAWDIPVDRTDKWETLPPFSEDRDIFGSNGVPPSYCVQDGMFSEENFKIPKFHYNGTVFPYPNCLRRKFSDKYPPFGWQSAQLSLTPPVSIAPLVDVALLRAFDLESHNGVGGVWTSIGLGADPMFFMFHSYIDKLFANYQLRDKTGNGYWNVSGELINFPWFTAADGIDIANLPGGVCLKWASSLPREKAIKMKYYAALEVPRTDHIYVPYEELRDMPYEDNDIPILKFMLHFYRLQFHTFSFDKEGFHVANITAFVHNPKLPWLSSTLAECGRIFAIDPSFADFNTSRRVEQILP